MNCSRNDVVLLPIPFTNLKSRKVRPAIVIGRNGADLFLVPISSVLPNTDFPIKEWRGAGLNVPSCAVRLAPMATRFPSRPPILSAVALTVESFIRPNRLFTIEQFVILYAAGDFIIPNGWNSRHRADE